MKIGDTFSILLDSNGGIPGHLLVTGVRGEISALTDKAVQIAAETRNNKRVTAWFPKSAFEIKTFPHENFGTEHHVCELKRWFRVDGWNAKFIGLTMVCY